MATTDDGRWYPDGVNKVGKLSSIFAQMQQSNMDASGTIKVTSLAALSAITGAKEGTIAVLIAANGGADQMALWVAKDTGQWVLASGIRLTSLTTFVASLSTYANLFSWAGQTFYDAATAVVGVWTDTVGGHEALTENSWNVIGYVTGTKSPGFGYSPRWISVPGGVRMAGTVAKTNNAGWANGNTLCTLPVGARPSSTQYFTLQGSGVHVANVQIGSDGKVNIKNLVNGAPVWLSLDQIQLAI